MNDLSSNQSTSITELGGSLIIAFADEMTDADISAMINVLTERAVKPHLTGAVMDFSMVSVMDSYSFNAFKGITKALGLVGLDVVWAGLRPSVICALLDLNADTDDAAVHTALSLEHGLDLLSEMRREKNHV